MQCKCINDMLAKSRVVQCLLFPEQAARPQRSQCIHRNAKCYVHQHLAKQFFDILNPLHLLLLLTHHS